MVDRHLRLGDDKQVANRLSPYNQIEPRSPNVAQGDLQTGIG